MYAHAFVLSIPCLSTHYLPSQSFGLLAKVDLTISRVGSFLAATTQGQVKSIALFVMLPSASPRIFPAQLEPRSHLANRPCPNLELIFPNTGIPKTATFAVDGGLSMASTHSRMTLSLCVANNLRGRFFSTVEEVVSPCHRSDLNSVQTETRELSRAF